MVSRVLYKKMNFCSLARGLREAEILSFSEMKLFQKFFLNLEVSKVNSKMLFIVFSCAGNIASEILSVTD
jgi:hypothetical protein